MDLLYTTTFHIFHKASNLNKLYLGNIFLSSFHDEASSILKHCPDGLYSAVILLARPIEKNTTLCQLPLELAIY